ncbi:hypothetical protein MLD38_013355 [Melastoma candidum]|uniref:Uncharacterized protein n=1 Tax=Melastoma candidum TaxID=119954 RepID=A0ACB9R9A2_9MYRT|nr:hypothetical protein MLD38_013355 [Melastoma candidum]
MTIENKAVAPSMAAVTVPSPTSPHNKVKFMCSHGGKILPRPPDGLLKYVGGETRVISVSRDINFSDLMAKLTGQIDSEMVLKYQVATEDLDVLVSVRSDEDLKHMLDEIDRQEKMSGSGNPKLRTFLFPTKPTMIESQGHHSGESHMPEQRYIDAVNGIIRGPPSIPRIKPLKVSRGSFGFWSACTSPTTPSPKDNKADRVPQEGLGGGLHMHKVKSSPSLCSMGNGASSCSSHAIPYHHNQPVGHYLNLRQSNHGNSLHPIPSVQYPSRAHMSAIPNMSYYYPPPTRYHHRESGSGRGMGRNYDDGGPYCTWRLEKSDSVPTSPRKPYWDGPYYRPEPLE